MIIDTNNILLITDYEEIAKKMLEKLVLLRENDSITICSTKDAKKMLQKSLYYIVILHETGSTPTTLRLIRSVKETSNNIGIILLQNEIDAEFTLKAYDAGISDYITIDSEPYEILIKTVNCFRMLVQQELNLRNEKFLNQLGVIDSKTGLYNYKHLKEIFIDISDNLRIQNGIFAVVTLDDKIKTRVSTNRLAVTIKNSVRKDDIIAVARGGNFYLILPNINMEGANALLQKIQDKMGQEFQIRAGLAKIGIQSFETLDKIALDSLKSAIQNDIISDSIEDTPSNVDSWLEDEQTEQHKNYKLFKVALDNKLENVITPAFFRCQKEFETKLTNTQVSQYTNNIECVFSLKNELVHSELIIRFNGFAKFKIEIIHSGLDSPENSKFEISLKEMTSKLVKTLLKQLKDEYKLAAYKKEN